MTSSPSTSAGSAAQQARDWRVGAIIEATAVRDADGQWMLSASTLRVPVRLSSEDGAMPTNGQLLKLRVVSNSPSIELETVDVEQSASTDALRRYLPRQMSPAPLVANLGWLTSNPMRTQLLPAEVVKAANALWNALPRAEELALPKSLEAAITRSGLQFESQLAAVSATHAFPANDLKALLSTLRHALMQSSAGSQSTTSTVDAAPLPLDADALSPLPNAPASLAAMDAGDRQVTELARQADGALARLTSLQISAHANPSAFVVELPVRQEERADMVRMRFERRASEQADAEHTWSVEVAMDLGRQGSMHARISWDSKDVSVQLRAESPTLVEAFKANVSQLKSALQAAGLQVEHITCLHGMPARETEHPRVSLVDVRA